MDKFKMIRNVIQTSQDAEEIEEAGDIALHLKSDVKNLMEGFDPSFDTGVEFLDTLYDELDSIHELASICLVEMEQEASDLLSENNFLRSPSNTGRI